MKNNILLYWFAILTISLSAVVSCGELDDTHKEYIEDGEQIYIGKPLLIQTNSGNERIKFNIIISADPKIAKGRITWNAGENSHEFDVVRTSEGFEVVSEELEIPEGSYAFVVTLHDNQGRTSLEYEHSALVYGPKYLASLLNRAISEIQALPSEATIKWATAETGTVETIFSYQNRNGEEKSVVISPETSELILDDYPIGGEYTIVTKYKPDELALETFETAPESSSFPAVVQLDRSIWQKVDLPTDGDLTCYGGGVPKLWDGDKSSWYHNGCAGDGTDGIPHHFTIDLGVSAGLSKFRVTPRQDCCQDRNPKHFQIWGIQDLEGAETTALTTDPNWADDATEKGWILLLDAETDASWTNAEDYEVVIPENVSVRYIRFRFLEAHNGGQDTALSEFVFWASSIN